MNPCDMPVGAAALAQCRAMLAGHIDRFGRWWDQEATPADQRVLLMIAGRASLYIGREWSSLPGDMRADIKRRAADLRGWLDRLPLTAEKVAA